MHKKVLVNEQIEEGKQLLEALRRAGIRWSAAFWYDEPEGDGWRLFIASRAVDELGIHKAYLAVHKLMRHLQPKNFSFLDVALLSPDEDDYRFLRNAVAHGGRPGGIAGGNLPRLVADDAYVYRI